MGHKLRLTVAAMEGSPLHQQPPSITDHAVDVGYRTEAVIIAELVKRGYRLLIPYGVNQRYDLVIDLDGDFVRDQCKTGRLRKGAVIFRPRSVRTKPRGSVERDYSGQADLFLVYCPETDDTYAVPVEEAPKCHMHLRVDPILNGQSRSVHWTRDYELPA
jgi:hypothetical protein